MKKKTDQMVTLGGLGSKGALILMNLFLLVFLVILTQIKTIDHIRDYRIVQKGGNETEEYFVYGENCVRQEFIYEEGINAFELQIEANESNYHGCFDVALLDEKNNIVQSWRTDKLELNSGRQGEKGWLCYAFNSDKCVNGERLAIEIKAPELDESSAIMLTMHEQDEAKDNEENLTETCIVNGHTTGKMLAFSVYQDCGNPFFWIAVVTLFITANLWWFTRKKGVEKYALIILLGTGIIMLMIMAPGSQPDEDYHYNSAVKLSNFILGKTDDINAAEEKIKFYFSLHNNTNTSFNKILNHRAELSDKTEQLPLTPRVDSLQYPLSYLAPALGITVSRLINGSYVQAYMLARLFSLLSFVGMAMLAIKLIPTKKELMLFICIMPMTMHQAVSASRDVLINGMALIYFANIARIIYQKKRFSWLDVLVSVALLALFAPMKVVYCLLAFLVFLVPREQFKSRIDYILKTFAVPLVISLLLYRDMMGTMKTQLTASTYAGHTDYYHIDFLFKHPVRYLRLILFTVEKCTWYYIECLIGYKLAGLTVEVNEIYPIIYLAVLLMSAMKIEEAKALLDTKQKLMSLIIFILGYLALLAAFSFANTIYGYVEVGGMQGRYIFPFIMLLFYALENKRIVLKIEKVELLNILWFVEIGYIVDVMSQITL